MYDTASALSTAAAAAGAASDDVPLSSARSERDMYDTASAAVSVVGEGGCIASSISPFFSSSSPFSIASTSSFGLGFPPSLSGQQSQLTHFGFTEDALIVTLPRT